MEREPSVLTLRRSLTEARELYTESLYFCTSYTDCCKSLKKYVNSYEAVDPLISGEYNYWVASRPSEPSAQSKLIDKDLSNRGKILSAQILMLCLTSGENSKEGIEQLWRTMEEFLPKSTIRSVYQRQFLNIGHKYMRSIINALFKLNIPLDDPNNLLYATQLLNPVPGTEEELSPKVLCKLWKDKGVKKAFAIMQESSSELDQTAEYIFGCLKRMCKATFAPSPTDQIFIQRISSGVREMRLRINETEFRLVGIDRLGPKQHEFTDMFSECTQILYITSLLADFIEIRHNIEVFHRFLHDPLFRKKSIIVIFYGVDAFKSIASNRDISVAFPEYSGGKHSDPALNFIVNLFLKHKTAYTGKIYSFQCEDINKKFITFLTRCTRDIALNNLAMDGLNIIN